MCLVALLPVVGLARGARAAPDHARRPPRSRRRSAGWTTRPRCPSGVPDSGVAAAAPTRPPSAASVATHRLCADDGDSCPHRRRRRRRARNGRQVGRLDATGLIPASNQKLFVAAVALGVLGPTHRFRPGVTRAAPAGGGVAGDVYLVGGGDPVLDGRTTRPRSAIRRSTRRRSRCSPTNWSRWASPPSTATSSATAAGTTTSSGRRRGATRSPTSTPGRTTRCW